MDGQTDRVTDARQQFRAMAADYLADRESTIVQLRALLREVLEAEIEEANNWGRCFEVSRETCARIEKAVKTVEVK